MTVTSFSVGATFRIINEASPALAKILTQIRELNTAITKAKENLATIGRGASAGLGTAVGETNALARAWTGVAEASAIATGNLNRATAASRRAAAGAGGGSVGGGRGMLGGQLGMGGHGGHFGTPAMLALGAGAYALNQSMHYDDAAVLMATHAGVDLKENRAKFRKMLEDATIGTGFGEHEVSAASQQELRMFGDTGGSNGVDVLPFMLKIAGTEARLKGTSIEESMTSLTGLAHMVQKYGEDEVKKLVPAFSVLSMRNPMNLAQQERAYGYAVPILQSSLGIDPVQVMAMSTALARGGITSTKAGTWVREMMANSLPGTSSMSKFMFAKHENALRALGLIDDKNQATWKTDGKLDPLKFLSTVNEHTAGMSVEDRNAAEKNLLGKQGQGALSVLTEPKVLEQLRLMIAEVKDPKTSARIENFMGMYNEESTLQSARTGLQTFNVLMGQIGDVALPAFGRGLTEAKSIMDQIMGRTPTPSVDKKWGVGTTALEGMGIGAGVGFLGGGIGALPGAGIGLVTGAIAGAAHDVLGTQNTSAVQQNTESLRGLSNALQNHGVFAGRTKNAPIPTVSINLDGRLIGQSVSSSMEKDSTFSTGAPASDSMDSFTGGDHHQMDK